MVSYASGVVRVILCSDCTDSTFTGRSEQSITALHRTERLIGKLSQPSCQDNFDEFAVQLLEASLLGILALNSAVQREKLLQAFHGVRVSKLVALWEQLLKSLEEDLDPLVQQYINQKICEDIKTNCCLHPSTTSNNSSISPDENIV